MKIIVSFSGGKDSQACLIQAVREFGAQNVEAVFCDTGWEHHLTYEHIEKVTKQLGVKLTTLRAEIGGFEQLCKRMKWFPDTQHRMCTVQLKIMPMIDYILNQKEDIIIIQGIRAAESAKRSKLPCSGNYFQEYFEEKRKKSLYRKKDVLAWCKKYTATVERPMLGMSAQEIINYILKAGQEPNELYKRGASRVGCYPCIFARLSEIKVMRHDLAYILRTVKLEEEVNRARSEGAESSNKASLFVKGKIPARFCKKYGNGVPAFEDIIEYVSKEDLEANLFEEDAETSCMSIYNGLCE